MISDELVVLEGPLDHAPQWEGVYATFVRTKQGLRKLGAPHKNGSFIDQIAVWGGELLFGGKPQYWRVYTGALSHPETRFEVDCKDGSLPFEVRLDYNLRILDAEHVVNRTIRTLKDHFTNSLRHDIVMLAAECEITESAKLRRDIQKHFGDHFGDFAVQGSQLAVRVHSPTSVDIATINAQWAVNQAQLDAFRKKTGGMTVHDIAMAAIATQNPQLMSAYKELCQRQSEVAQRNRETLHFLLDMKVIDVHDLQKHIGPLPADLIKSLLLGQQQPKLPHKP